jgi:uncharacterized protein (DUF1499 family)
MRLKKSDTDCSSWQKLIASVVSSLCLALLLTLSNLYFVEAAVALPLHSAPMVASLFHFSGNRPTNLGVREGKLAPCPTTPNCVSSQSLDSAHKIEPLTYNTSAEAAFTNLKKVVQASPRAQIVDEKDHYLYAEFTSALMGFVDDVEFYLDEGAKVIHVRSASRLGESDLGVNRQRVETIREKLSEQMAAA